MREARALAAVAAILVSTTVWIALSLPATAQCGTDISGGIYDSGSYGAGGSAGECESGGGGSGDSSPGLTVERIVRSEPSICAGTPDALLEILEYYNSQGLLVDRVSRCVGAIVPGELVPVPPPPPSPTEVMERLPLPAPEVHTSPPGQGLVGFETYFWWGAVTTLPPVNVQVGEWSATVTPQLEQVRWDFGNGDSATSDRAGNEADPSVVYTYTSQCDCTVTVTATWGGTVSLSHPLLGAPLTQQATGVAFSESLPYDVIEREAVVVG